MSWFDIAAVRRHQVADTTLKATHDNYAIHTAETARAFTASCSSLVSWNKGQEDECGEDRQMLHTLQQGRLA